MAESEAFVAVPSLGALVPGWLLIVPRMHVLNLASMNAADLDLCEEFLESVLLGWEQEFGALTLFEHGPARPGTAPGCGVDHAHMHVVPTQGIELLAAAQRRMPELVWQNVTSLGAARDALGDDRDYLFLRTEDDTSWLATGRVPSQALRKVMAAELGRPDDFDWRCNPELDVVRATIQRVRQTS